jgi:hypothetical protein
LTRVPIRKIEAEFREGVGPFRFGMTPEQAHSVFAILDPKFHPHYLARAPEYRTADVRYMWRWFEGSPDLSFFHGNAECIARGEKGYITLLFQDDWLFEISLRAMKGHECPYRESLMRKFAAKYNIPVLSTPTEEHFRYEGRDVSVIGKSTSYAVYIDFSAR